MHRILLFCMAIIICLAGKGQQKMKAGFYMVPDSVKAMGFITDVTISNKNKSNKIFAFLQLNNNYTFGLVKNKNKKELQWYFSNAPQLKEKMQSAPFDWEYGKTYSLLIMIASDSAKNTSICSGYIHLKSEHTWKLVHTQSFNTANSVHTIFAASNSKDHDAVQFNNRWLIRNNNSWKALDSDATKQPVLRPMTNLDSIVQQKIEEDHLRIKLNKDSVIYKEGIFYQTVKEGNGQLVNLTDTVKVFYKGWLFNNGNVFDETKENSVSFPLSRLIRGWQIGVPQCKVGGKIRLFIPSGSAYGIRTFSTNIPPNNTLVFDVEVVEVKEKK